ncbi:hypothetical protein ASO14_1199 [Kurthia sp. 11kri321]|uniref:hypothetical protein n=1 Tax=Kurthia sp. 11kri321 TaxID=1750719 RepID=UPI000745D8CE|nr:hypothetical protein [Kurthia sp. 11kri321]AMA62242.1 hypothetical protein ASO14_1199 [Kurthia sp. 11kri321]
MTACKSCLTEQHKRLQEIAHGQERYIEELQDQLESTKEELRKVSRDLASLQSDIRATLETI